MRSVALVMIGLAGLVAGCGKSGPAPTPDEPSPVSDKERIQGVWKVEAVEVADQVGANDQEKQKEARFQFKGDLYAVVEAPGQPFEWLTFTLEPTSEPKVITISEPPDAKNNKPEKMEWLYKFEGDVLVLAIGMPRPTEFKPRAPSRQPDGTVMGAVVVVRLKKTDEVPVDPPKQTPAAKYTEKVTVKGSQNGKPIINVSGMMGRWDKDADGKSIFVLATAFNIDPGGEIFLNDGTILVIDKSAIVIDKDKGGAGFTKCWVTVRDKKMDPKP